MTRSPSSWASSSLSSSKSAVSLEQLGGELALGEATQSKEDTE